MNESLPVVTLDMMCQVEHCCPTGMTRMHQMRWKAKHLTEMLAIQKSAPVTDIGQSYALMDDAEKDSYNRGFSDGKNSVSLRHPWHDNWKRDDHGNLMHFDPAYLNGYRHGWASITGDTL